MVDISKIKVGDTIEVVGRFAVKAIDLGDAALPVQVKFYDDDRQGVCGWFPSHVITAHHPKPKPLGVGDRVKTDSGATVYEILALPREWHGGRREYAVWSQETGVIGYDAERVETWERVS